METKINILEQFLKLVENVTGFLEKFGIIKLFKTVFAIIIMYWIIILSFNPSKIFEAYERYQEKIHKEKVEDTYQKQYKIKNNVLELHYATKALRTLVLCCHNGSQSLGGGYQFLKCSALFEECGDHPSVMEDYQNIHLTQFPIFSYLQQHQVFCGTIEDLKVIDNKLYYRLLPNNVKYLHIQALIGQKGDIVGFMVITWDSVHNDCEHIHKHIYNKSLAISRLME